MIGRSLAYYEILQKIGSGGMGRSIWRKTPRTLGSLQLDHVLGGLRDVADGNATDVSADGSTLLFAWRAPPTGFRIWSLPLAEEGQPEPLFASTGSQDRARFSPDGRAIAYLSNDGGRYEAYAVMRDGLSERVQVSKEGAWAYDWGRESREIIYQANDGRMFSVPVTTTGSHLELGEATLLFETPRETPWVDFDVTPDGERIIAIVQEVSGDALAATVVLDWPSSVR